MKKYGALFVSRRVALGLLGSVMASAALPQTAMAVGSDGAASYVNQLANEVMRLANSGAKGNAVKSKFASLLNRYVNLRAIANMALGPYQKKISAGDREKLYGLFSNYAAALFAYYVSDFQGDSLEIKSNTQDGSVVTIQSAIVQKGGGREQVKWRLVQSGGSYRVSDINVKGVWLTIATKKRFTDVLNRSKGDMTPLFAELREADTW